MSNRPLETVDMDFDLYHPCEDCPFSHNAPESHGGVIGSIPQYVELMEAGTLSHTCHKTDNRVSCDGPRNFKGDKPKHCAGLLHMQVDGIGIQTGLQWALANEKIDLDRLCDAAGSGRAFKDIPEMARHYAVAIWARLLLMFDNPSVYIDDETMFQEDPPAHRYLDVKDEKLVKCCKCGLPASHLDSMHPYGMGFERCGICHGDAYTIERLIDLVVKYAPNLPKKAPRWVT